MRIAFEQVLPERWIDRRKDDDDCDRLRPWNKDRRLRKLVADPLPQRFGSS